MTSTNWIWDFLAWLSLPLLVLLVGVMVWRKHYKKFPLFFFYVLTTCLIGAIRFIAYKGFSTKTYFYVYWGSEFVTVVVAFSALYETFLRRIFPGFSKVRFYRYLFPGAAFLIAALAFLTAINAPDKRAAFFITSRILDFLRSAVIGFFVVLILFMGRLFTGQEFSIASGFGIQAAISLVNAAIRTLNRYKPTALDRFEPIAFDLACLIWLWSFSRPRQSIPADIEIAPETLHEARKWEDTLRDLITPDKH